jgi:hypothetical protein
VLPLLLSLGGLVLLLDAARRVVPPPAALVVLAIATFNPLLITFGGRLKAEAAFFFFAMLTVWAFAVPQLTRKRALLGGGAAIASAFMRSVGIGVIAAVLVHLLLARRRAWALRFGLAAALLFGPWLTWSFVGPRQVVGRSYAGDLVRLEQERAERTGRSPLVERARGLEIRTARYTLGHLPASMGFPQVDGTLIDNLGWVALLATVGLAGLVVLWRRLRPAVLVAGAIYAVLLIWPWADRRFLHPLVPLVGLGLVAGGWVFGRRAGRVGAVLGPLLVAALLVPGTQWRTRDVIQRGWRCDHADPVATCYTKTERAYLQAAVASRRLPDSAIVLAEREATFAYYSGRKAAFANQAVRGPSSDFLSYLRRAGVTHVLISRVTDTEPVGLAQRLAEICRDLTLVGDFGEGTELFALRSPAAADSSGGDACPTAQLRFQEAVREREARRQNPDLFQLPDSR